MSLKVQASFSSGELDPILHERTTLQKFKNGLATARNVIVGKTGSILTRPGRSDFAETKLDDREVLLYSPNRSGYLIEWGHLYVRAYDFDGTLLYDVAHTFTEDDLPNIHFATSGLYIYVFLYGSKVKKFNYVTGVFYTAAEVFAIPTPPVNAGFTIVGTTGYVIDYQVTYVLNGQESFALTIPNGGILLLPIAVGQSNTIDSQLTTGIPIGVSEMRVYRRPGGGGAFGFIGSTTNLFITAGNLHGAFVDLGDDADYTHSPPTPITPNQTDPINLLSKTGTIYQQRLLVTDSSDLEAILASRPGYQNNFFREYPLTSDSALKFKAGSEGFSQVLRLLDADGLIAFTTTGVYLNTGALSTSNLAFEKKGKWVINQYVPPLSVPGGVFFVDEATNSVRNLIWSNELASYNGLEVSIFSQHLFAKRQVVSWAFQEGNFPLLWVVFDDGTFASFTYDFDQEMRAWTRHDSAVEVESVCGTGIADLTFFVVKNGTTRHIEITVPRYVPVRTLAIDPQADKNPSIALMDSMVHYNGLMNGSLVGTDQFDLNPVVADDWEGELTLTCGTSALFPSPGVGEIGTVFRVFNNEDFTSIDLEIVSRNSDDSVVVQPSVEFPSDEATAISLYVTVIGISGLSHMEGEFPGVIVDGFVIASPNNDQVNYPALQVTGGLLYFPDGVRGCMVHVGRPVVADVETLDIDTVEQSPTLIESMTVNKLEIKVHKSSGLYVAHKFPADDKVTGMQPVESYDVDYEDENPIIGNRYKPPVTKRVEMTLPGDWKSNGRLAARQVDPLHFEILSIIPDIEILGRGK